MQRLGTLQQYFDQSLNRALQDSANQFIALQTQMQTLIGNVNQLAGVILEVDDHCKRFGNTGH